jgi:hypothetical protein
LGVRIFCCREKLKKGSIKAGLFAKDIEIKADSLYTGERNDAFAVHMAS